MSNHQLDSLTRESRKIAELTELAEQGDAGAQYRIGLEISMNNVFVYDPVEVAERIRKAADWFRKAAEQGHADAMFCHGLTYFFRCGDAEKPDNNLKAMAWLNLAAELGVQGTIPFTRGLTLNMTEEQIAEAESMKQAYREAYDSEQGNDLALDETLEQNFSTEDQHPSAPGL